MPSRIAFATLVVGMLDITEACVFWFFYRGASPLRIFQSVAAGVLGRDSFTGGAATAVLGLALHFFIAFCVVLTYALASRRLPLLAKHPVACGAVFGVLVYLVMSFAVVPVSRAGKAKWSWPTVANGLFAHIACVGIPAGLLTTRRRA
jgi:uncharacterized membrane protein YagU involved in acid resistance